MKKLDSAKFSRFLWCIWLGTILGGLYLLDYSEPYDSVSQARTYSFAALGALLGLWLCSLPNVHRALLRVPCSVRRIIWIFGLALTVSLGALEFLRFGDLLVTRDIRLGARVPTYPILEFCSVTFGEYSNTSLSWFLIGATHAIDSYEPLLACLFAFLCLLCGCLSGIFNVADITPAHNNRLSQPDEKKPLHDSVGIPIAYVVSFCFGAVQAWAWSIFLPSPPFPLPLRDTTYAMVDLWGEVVPALSAVPVFLVGTFAWLALKATRPGFMPLFAAACVGNLFSQMLERICPNVAAISLPFAIMGFFLQVVFLATLVYLVRWNTQVVTEETKPAPQRFSADIQEAESRFSTCINVEDVALLVTLGLAPGELNAVRAAVLGLNSSEAAQILGVRPPTVRAWRSRVCSKLGIPNIHQLVTDLTCRTGLFAARESDTSGNSTVGTSVSGARSETVLTACCIAGTLSCIELILLPYGHMASIWEVPGFMAIGCSMGCGIALILQAVRSYKPISQKPQVFIWIFAVIVLTLSLTVIALLHLDVFTARTATTLPLRRGMLVVATACCTSFLCHSLARTVEKIRVCRASQRTVVPAVLVSAAIGGLACIGDIAWLVALVVSWVLLCVGVLGLAKANDTSLEEETRLFPFVGYNSPDVLLVAGCIGFVWEEVWRGHTYVSLQGACVPFLIVIALLFLWRCRRLGCSPTLPVSIVAACLPIAYAMGPCAALLFACNLAVVSFACIQREADLQMAGGGCILHSPLFALAAGMCVGMYAVNLFGTNLLRISSFTVQGSHIFERTVFWLIFILFLIASLAYAVSAIKKTHARDRPIKAAVLSDSERLHSHLAGKGLTPLQIEVVSILAEGKNTSYAAESLGYSRSVIDRARREAFARLGVRNCLQLVRSFVDERPS